MECRKLSEISEGQSAVVESVECNGNMKRRFMDLGLVKGTRVNCLLASSYNSIRAYSVRGSVIAIRKKDAESIIVRGADMNENGEL